MDQLNSIFGVRPPKDKTKVDEWIEDSLEENSVRNRSSTNNSSYIISPQYNILLKYIFKKEIPVDDSSKKDTPKKKTPNNNTSKRVTRKKLKSEGILKGE